MKLIEDACGVAVADVFYRLGEALPAGRHWEPGLAFNAEDVETLKKIGGRLGWAGNVIDLGVGLHEWKHVAPFGAVAAKTAGGMAGAWTLGMGGAERGGMVVGPPGAFVGALVLGTAGAFGGEAGAQSAYKWLTE